MSTLPRGTERRSIERHQLNDYLTVFNRNTQREMGSIGNISGNGLMLISTVPVMVGGVYSMRVVLPVDGGEDRFIDFDARCHWCRPDVEPEHFDSGYSIVQTAGGVVDLVEALREYFSFSGSTGGDSVD